jgi:hypothetical protein
VSNFLEVVLDKSKPFYVLGKYVQGEESFLLFDNQESAIKKIGEFLKDDVPTDQITLLELTIVPNGLSTQEIEWGSILNKLVKVVGLK